MQIPGTRAAIVSELHPQSLSWLAALVLLAQLPHYLYLPWWVTLFGTGVIATRVWRPARESYLGKFLLNRTILTIIAAFTALAVRLHYGYFLGRDPCVAFLFLLVAFKFAESKNSKDATLLICLSGFLLLTQYFYGQSILSALISVPAVLATGACLIRVRDNTGHKNYFDAIKLTGKLLIQGAPIAAILFLLFPRLPGPLWNLPTDSVAKTGLSDTMSPGSISSLSLSSDVAFRVDFDGEPPPPEQRYWRGPVLSLFDGRRWSMDTGNTRPPMMANATKNTITYTVTMEPHYRNRLFAMDFPASLPISSNANSEFEYQQPLAHLTNDLQLLTNEPVSKTIRYQQRSTMSAFYSEYNPALKANTELPGINIEAQEIAKKFRQSNPSDKAYVNAVLNWFHTDQFHYTLAPRLLGSQPVDEFLLRSKEGFCEHYASAFVVLMRAASIPARVVTGYLGGQMNGDYMIIRQSDAHAWAEVWMDKGWIRFDPTAAVAPERVESVDALLPGLTRNQGFSSTGAQFMEKLRLGLDAINHRWQRTIIDFNNHSQYRFWEKLGFTKPEPWHIVAVIIAFGTLWCLIVLRFDFGRKKTTEEERLWARYCRHLEKAGLPKRPSEGPIDYLSRCQSHWPAQAEIFQKITDSLNELRFANPDKQPRATLLSESCQLLKELPPSFKLHQR